MSKFEHFLERIQITEAQIPNICLEIDSANSQLSIGICQSQLEHGHNECSLVQYFIKEYG